ncbi:MAG: acylneuraminate cytidylyltransferase family protein, partial [Candidatus Omnitrophica bacterium]|nr:acylneuraminate cytidylyltransferase family protein [Candidatus Omnitrophota bacterium]
VYDMTTVAYAAVASYILKASSLLEGRVKVVEIPSERAIDIDTMLDFEIAECLINKRGRK